jgi:hypothetical protein
MPKSALRKRFGIYYTPSDFTELIVNQTVGELIRQRVEPLTTVPEKLAALRSLKVVDPACGSGAFLIAAYERLDAAYGDLVRLVRINGDDESAATLESTYADYILHENLYGVDLSHESVEITQLALWIRSARKDKTLADLSKNIVCGNSLVSDPAVHPRAIDWRRTFPQVFGPRPSDPPAMAPRSGMMPPPYRAQPTALAVFGPRSGMMPPPYPEKRPHIDTGGFDCVIGNPPWERMKLQQREFFALGAPDIASAVNAATRRKLIAAAEKARPDLFQRYTVAATAAEQTLAYIRKCEAFPLTARGDVNTYMVFAELARKLVAPTGRVGLLVPSGVATDDTTRHFFSDLMEKQSLVALYDFENKKGHFEDVHRAFKFSVLLMTGDSVKHAQAAFVFFANQIEDLAEKDRQITLSAKDLKLVNPNTRTCPIFRTKRDAELTKAIYKRVPVLIDESRKEGGNPWSVKFVRMFDQTNDAEKFVDGATLKEQGFKLDGNRWTKGKDRLYRPLYEAKMVQAYDHRAAGVRVEAGNWMRQGQTDETSLVEHQNPEFVVLPRYWVDTTEVDPSFESQPAAFLGFKDITSPVNRRTMIASFIPYSAVTNHFPVILSTQSARSQACILANLNSIAFDYATRQKIGGITLNFFIVEQLPTLPPDAYAEKCPWDKNQTLEKWISERVLRLTCTSDDMRPLAEAAGFRPGIVKWKEEERAQLRAELDAAYFRLYGIEADDIEYILGTFQEAVDEDEAHGGVGPTRQRIRDALEWIK